MSIMFTGVFDTHFLDGIINYHLFSSLSRNVLMIRDYLNLAPQAKLRATEGSLYDLGEMVNYYWVQ